MNVYYITEIDVVDRLRGKQGTRASTPSASCLPHANVQSGFNQNVDVGGTNTFGSGLYKIPLFIVVEDMTKDFNYLNWHCILYE